MIGRPRSSTLFPSGPLSRSQGVVEVAQGRVEPIGLAVEVGALGEGAAVAGLEPQAAVEVAQGLVEAAQPAQDATRSEEHTSELQSPCNLVCRLLLEKKKEPT